MDDAPALEVGFQINLFDAFGQLRSLDDVVGEVAANTFREFQRMEQASGGAINMGSATAQMQAFGNATTREMQNAVRETNRAEKAGEAMVRQLQRQTETFGKTTSEIRNMRAEQRALAAESQGLTELAGRIRALNSEMVGMERGAGVLNKGLGGVATGGKLAGHHAQNLAFQFQDLGLQMAMAAQSSAPLKMGLMALFQQGTQISGVMSQAGLSIAGLGKQMLLMAAPFAPFIAVAGAATVAFALFADEVNKGVSPDDLTKGLGLTAEEIKKLEDVTVTWGDVALGVWDAAKAAVSEQLTAAFAYFGTTASEVWEKVVSFSKTAVNVIIGASLMVPRMIAASWSKLPAAVADIFFSAVNLGIDAINGLVKASVNAINSVIGFVNQIPGMELPTIEAAQIERVKNDYAGAGAELGKALGGALKDSFTTDFLGDAASSIRGFAVDRARARMEAQAKKIIEDRDKATKASGNGLAEKLEREALAVEAEIVNLYDLADAYKASGAAALIAEARVKAESKAIKQRGEIEAYVNREVRLAIANRVVDAAKATASLREQADAKARVNEMVSAGLVPADRAAELVKDQIADLPLLAALQAAQQRGLTEEAARATAALADQRAERERLRAVEEQASFNSDMAAGRDRLAELAEEKRLIGATNSERAIALATLKATQEADAKFTDPARRAAYIAQQIAIAMATEEITNQTRALNDELAFAADRWDLIASNVQNAANGMADAFGEVGRAIGDVASIFAAFHATRERLDLEHQRRLEEWAGDQKAIQRENAKYALQTATLEIGALGDMTSAAKDFFDEKSKGYKALAVAEKAFRAIEFALSVRAMAQDAIETVQSVLNSGARATANGAEGVAEQSKLPFPLNLAAMAATAAALVAMGVAVVGSIGGGGKNTLEKANDGTGTVLGDAEAKSESIRNAINALKDVDTVTSVYAREMAASLRSIDSQVGGLATVLVRAGNINASDGIGTGFQPNLIGKMLGSIPLVGGLLGGLFGTKTTVIGSGLYGGAQSLGDILADGYDAQTYSDIKKKKKFLGVTTSTKYRTQYGEADPLLENQFTLILKSFNDAILAAAGPLGASTADITARLQTFVIDIGKIDLQGLTGAEIEEKLQAVFGAAADNMAAAAFPGMEKFQQVGEGMFETLVRVASTVEAVSTSLRMLGNSAQVMNTDALMGLADQFESVADLTSAADAYLQAYYTKEEQAAAKTVELTRVMDSLGLAMPSTLAGFRALVEAQDLTTAAGQATYAALLQLAPAFADLQAAMVGAKSAADIAAERENLQRQIYQLLGNTAALRAMELAKLDVSNRALQEQVWAIQDAQEAAKAAEQLRDAWKSVSDTIMDEVERIRGLNGAGTGANFATLMGQFNAATEAARAGDMDAAKDLPGLSQAMLAAAALVARTRQELDRVQADTAASLEATSAAIEAYASGQQTEAQILDAANTTQQASSTNDNDSEILRLSYEDMKAELAGLRAEMANGMATIAGHTGKTRRILEDVTAASGGDAISTVYGAA